MSGDPDSPRIQLIPLEYLSQHAPVVDELIRRIWPHRADTIIEMFRAEAVAPETDHPYLILCNRDFIGITGFYRYDETAVGLCWHGVVPEMRKQGLSRLAFDDVRLLASVRYPDAVDIVELIPSDRDRALTRYFEKLGFRASDELVQFEWLPAEADWQAYRAPLSCVAQ